MINDNRVKIPVYSIFCQKDQTPLSLGMIISYAKNYKNGFLKNYYEFIPSLIFSKESARKLITQHGPGVVLSSDYLWLDAQHMEISKLVKDLYPESITIHGGPSVPKYDYACDQYFKKNNHVDIAVRGEGEITASELLESIALNPESFWSNRDFLKDIKGITYRKLYGDNGEHFRTPERERVEDLDTLPSPYLTGYFQPSEAKGWINAIIETNRGCPYGCAYCDWGSATLQKIRKFSIERLRREFEWIAKNQIEIIFMADSNFGIFDRDIEIAEIIASVKREYGYPKQVLVNYAKNGTDRIAKIIHIWMKVGIAANGIISLQTQDQQTLDIIQRTNIKTQRYEELIEVFRKEKLPVSTDLMIGLPGQTIKSFKEDLQFCFDRRIYAQAYLTMILPNSPMAHRDYMRKYSIRLDGSGYIISTSTFTPLDRWTIQSIYALDELYVGCSLLKYFLIYLQIDHNICAVQFLADLYDQLSNGNKKLSFTSKLAPPFMNFMDYAQQQVTGMLFSMRLDDWRTFHNEIADFVHSHYGITRDSAMNTIFSVQEAIMPGKGREFPQMIKLEHDVIAYFNSIQHVKNLGNIKNENSNFKTLNEYACGEFELEDPLSLCNKKWGNGKDCIYNHHNFIWELRTELNPYDVNQCYITSESRRQDDEGSIPWAA